MKIFENYKLKTRQNESFGLVRSLEQGQAMIIAVIFFVWVSTATILGLSTPIVRHISMATSIVLSKESFYTAEAGMEDAVYRLKAGLPIGNSETLTIGNHQVVTTIADILDGKRIIANGDAASYKRKIETELILGTGISFHYGIQAGQGGFVLENTSSVTGNVHSSGPVVGAGNTIDGDVVSAGASGLIDDIYVTGSAYSHNITDSTIGGDAFYMTLTGSTVSGSLHPNSPDQPTAPLPISDAQIDEWKDEALAGTVIDSPSCSGGTYTVTSSITIGPAKINCNLLIKGNDVVFTLSGPVWVVGNITTQTSPLIRIAASLGNQNVAFIADNPSDRITGSVIDLGQSTNFQGSGSPNSFVFMISQNNSAESGGTTDAINIGQSAGALVAYASHGQITLGQSVDVTEATAYKIILKNTANVTYDTGLPSTLFSGGPSGGFDIFKWKEVE